jgi:peptidoglycan/LPS O-acetylase OafA/YrhL
MDKIDTLEQGYIKPLTGIRAIAAFMVFITHYNHFEKGTFVHSFFSQFYTGVSIFFVLSGFLITYRYYDRYQWKKGWFLTYIRNRVARIYPVYFLLTTMTFLVFLITDLHKDSQFTSRQIVTNSLWVYFTNITFIRGFLHDLIFSLVPQGWSLSVEEFFYFSAPITWLLIRRRFNMLYQTLALLVAGLMLVYIGKHIHFYGFFDTEVFMLKFTYFGKAFQFFAGMWLAFQIQKGAAKPLLNINKTYTGLGLTILIIAGIAVGWEHQQLYVTIFLDNVVLSFAIALFFWGLITEKSWVSDFLSTPIMRLLGRSSYAFYMIHVGVSQQFLENYISRNVFVQFVLLNLLAIAVYKWIETPMMLLIKGRKVEKKVVPVQGFATYK